MVGDDGFEHAGIFEVNERLVANTLICGTRHAFYARVSPIAGPVPNHRERSEHGTKRRERPAAPRPAAFQLEQANCLTTPGTAADAGKLDGGPGRDRTADLSGVNGTLSP